MLVAFNIEKLDALPTITGGCDFTLLNQQLHRAEPAVEGLIMDSGGQLRALTRCIGSVDAKLRKTLLRWIFTGR
jgi:hypothetical protein